MSLNTFNFFENFDVSSSCVVTIPACNGSITIPSGVQFGSFFENSSFDRGPYSEETLAVSATLKKKATFCEMFCFNGQPVKELFLTERQILEFIKSAKKESKVYPWLDAILLFPTIVSPERFYVYRIHSFGQRIHVDSDSLSTNYIWEQEGNLPIKALVKKPNTWSF